MRTYLNHFRFGVFLSVIGMIALSRLASAQITKIDYSTQEKTVLTVTNVSITAVDEMKPRLSATSNLKGFIYTKDSTRVQQQLKGVTPNGNRLGTKQDTVLLLAPKMRSWRKE